MQNNVILTKLINESVSSYNVAVSINTSPFNNFWINWLPHFSRSNSVCKEKNKVFEEPSSHYIKFKICHLTEIIIFIFRIIEWPGGRKASQTFVVIDKPIILVWFMFELCCMESLIFSLTHSLSFTHSHTLTHTYSSPDISILYVLIQTNWKLFSKSFNVVPPFIIFCYTVMYCNLFLFCTSWFVIK